MGHDSSAKDTERAVEARARALDVALSLSSAVATALALRLHLPLRAPRVSPLQFASAPLDQRNCVQLRVVSPPGPQPPWSSMGHDSSAKDTERAVEARARALDFDLSLSSAVATELALRLHLPLRAPRVSPLQFASAPLDQRNCVQLRVVSPTGPLPPGGSMGHDHSAKTRRSERKAGGGGGEAVGFFWGPGQLAKRKNHNTIVHTSTHHTLLDIPCPNEDASTHRKPLGS